MRDWKVSWAVQCCSCTGILLWVTLTSSSWCCLSWLFWRCPCFWVMPGMVEQPQPWSRGISLAQEKPASMLNKGFGECFLAVSSMLFSVTISPESFWESGDLSPEYLGGEYKILEKVGKLLRQCVLACRIQASAWSPEFPTLKGLIYCKSWRSECQGMLIEACSVLPDSSLAACLNKHPLHQSHCCLMPLS